MEVLWEPGILGEMGAGIAARTRGPATGAASTRGQATGGADKWESPFCASSWREEGGLVLSDFSVGKPLPCAPQEDWSRERDFLAQSPVAQPAGKWVQHFHLGGWCALPGCRALTLAESQPPGARGSFCPSV